jgi:hypothetical protein
VPYTNSLEQLPKPASINLQKWFLSPTGQLNLDFILRKNLPLCSSYLPLGVPNWAASTDIKQLSLAPLPGRKRIYARESLTSNLLLSYCFAYFLYFIFVCIFISKIQKNWFLYSCYFCLSAFSLARMSTPENTKLCDFTSINNNDFICTPIAPPAPEANFYEIKPTLLNLVMKEQFFGASTNDAATHLNNFVELCEMQKYKDIDGDIIKLKLLGFLFLCPWVVSCTQFSPAA